MSFLDKAKNLIAENADKVDAAIDKVGDIVDEKTGDKYQGVVDKAQEAAKNAARDLDLPGAWAALRDLGSPAHVRGAGVSGDTTAGGLARVDFSVRPDTDVVVVALVQARDLAALADQVDVAVLGVALALGPTDQGEPFAVRVRHHAHDAGVPVRDLPDLAFQAEAVHLTAPLVPGLLVHAGHEQHAAGIREPRHRLHAALGGVPFG